VLLTTGVPVTDRLVEVEVFQITALFPVNVMLPVPNAMVRVLLLADVKIAHVSLKLFSVTVPVVKVNVPVNVGAPDRLRLMSDLFTVQPEQAAVAATVTVAAVPLFASKTTKSTLVGTDANGIPPDVADQLRIEVPSHVPDPPTQYLVAID